MKVVYIECKGSDTETQGRHTSCNSSCFAWSRGGWFKNKQSDLRIDVFRARPGGQSVNTTNGKNSHIPTEYLSRNKWKTKHKIKQKVWKF